MMSETDNNLQQTLLNETAKIPWSELQRFFAAGQAILIDAQLDLITVATEISNDNKVVIEQWMSDNKIIHVPDEKAKKWVEEDTTVWAVVVKPWVLVQEIKKKLTE